MFVTCSRRRRRRACCQRCRVGRHKRGGASGRCHGRAERRDGHSQRRQPLMTNAGQLAYPGHSFTPCKVFLDRHLFFVRTVRGKVNAERFLVLASFCLFKMAYCCKWQCGKAPPLLRRTEAHGEGNRSNCGRTRRSGQGGASCCRFCLQERTGRARMRTHPRVRTRRLIFPSLQKKLKPQPRSRVSRPKTSHPVQCICGLSPLWMWRGTRGTFPRGARRVAVR